MLCLSFDFWLKYDPDTHTTIQRLVVSKILFNFFNKFIFFHQECIKLQQKLQQKLLSCYKKIMFQINAVLYSSKKYIYYTIYKLLTTLIIIKTDTKDWSNDSENSVYHHR